MAGIETLGRKEKWKRNGRKEEEEEEQRKKDEERKGEYRTIEKHEKRMKTKLTEIKLLFKRKKQD